MKFIALFILLFFSALSFGESCIRDILQSHKDDGVIEINEFPDLNNDGLPETIVLLEGSMRENYAVIYLESVLGCFTPIYSGTERVGITNSFPPNNRMQTNEFNGFKLLRDSSYSAHEVTILLFAYDDEQGGYRIFHSTTEKTWIY